MSRDDESFRRYVLAQLRSARKRALLLVSEIETIGIALKGGFIDAETAVAWSAEVNALEFLRPEEPDDGKDEELCGDVGRGVPVGDVLPG